MAEKGGLHGITLIRRPVRLHVGKGHALSLPAPESLYGGVFSPEDTTAGAETELQAVVAGRKSDVDLPLMIEQSNYLANVMRRAASGDAPRKLGGELVRFLNEGGRNVWENSWVRFPRALLNRFALDVLRGDLSADKADPQAGPRSDIGKFSFVKEGIEYLRYPSAIS